MTDKELADKVVALGVGGHTNNRTGDGKYYYEMRKHERGVWVFDYMLEDLIFVKDWRVAGALIEKCKDICWAKTTIGGSWVHVRASKQGYAEQPNGNGNVPRAIIEACVEALTND